MNFEKVIDRQKTNSMKWDFVSERYGSDDLWPMWVADMDFRAPQPVLDAMQEVINHGVFGYHRRPDSLFEATASWLKKRFDWGVENNQLVYTPGVVPAISHLIQTFTEKGDGVIIQPPVYYPFYALINYNDRKLLRNPLKETEQGFAMDIEDLEKQMQEGAKMLLLCSPHNPIGRVWSQEELEQVAKLCEKYNVLVVSDEIHADLVLKGTHTPFAKLAADKGMDVDVITCMAPSKTFNLAALQLSYVVFQQEEAKKQYEEQLQRQFVGIDNPFATVAAEAAYREGEEWLEKLLDYVQDNVDFVKQYIETNIPVMNVIEPEGTYLVWIDMRELNMGASKLQSWLREEGKLALSDGHIFGNEGAGFARINVAAPRANVEEGLNRLKQAYDKL
ncbi:cystathione beta-lyase [Alteribacillus persepolensis]|uniref:cysteine-S-conjugate beta-lyase n=1 Tax=Alteribacillus persepolensis TaxID=568899 RepID=A0A1G8E1G1_9BACI|nr:MalY/PatB family protein [Alteribacillus persepolensis]SDH63776.1 cystathione beta-lyase [Alteribacillus persepolensis]